MSSRSSFSDYELLKKVTGNDKKALETLYLRYSPVVYPLLLKIIRNEKIAEETLVDVFVLIWRKVSSFNFNTDNVYAWIITIARNKAIDVIRRLLDEDNVEEYTDEYENNYIMPVLSQGIMAMDMKAAQEMKANISDAFNNLTDAQKYVIELAYYEGLTESEISEKLNIPLPTVQSKIKMTLTSLNEFLIKSRKKQ